MYYKGKRTGLIARAEFSTWGLGFTIIFTIWEIQVQLGPFWFAIFNISTED